MKLFRVLASATLFFGAMHPSTAYAAHTLLPAPSVWSLDASKSNFDGAPTLKGDIWQIQVSTAKRFKYTDVMILDTGERVNNAWDGPHDGSMRPAEGMPGVTMSYNYADDTMHAVMADGGTLEGRMSLSADKKTLTIVMDFQQKSGKLAHQKLVYERTR